jgi:hypothetical protein
METKPQSAGEQKIAEYVVRIKNGESKESIFKGLSPAFVSGIEEGLQKQEASPFEQKENAQSKISELVTKVSEGRKQVVKDLYKNLLASIKYPDSRKTLAEALFQDVYNTYRIAEYPIDPKEETVWETYLRSTTIPINNKKPEWMYRGNIPTHGEETVTRASLNVHVTPELIDQLDAMIISGKMRANYKFGQPGTSASPTERHDSITVYFLEEPTQEILQEITKIIKPYTRGNNLLGKKISNGFFMSEVGSIENQHIADFIAHIETLDPSFAEAVRAYTSPTPGKGVGLKMSEAQYYAVKDVAHAFGHEIAYTKDSGFVLNSTSGAS